MDNNDTKQELDLLASQIRLYSMQCMKSVGSGHVGGVLSLAELMAVLYGEIMRVNPSQPKWEDRDRLVMSKGHCGPVLYSALAIKGFFPIEALSTLNADNTILPSHCNVITPGVDISTGSLGQGFSLAAGIALALKKKKTDEQTYLILGDGECNEGQVWEAAMFAAHYQLDNLIAFVDHNKKQLDGYTEDVMSLGSLKDKFESFGWYVYQVNGHSVVEIKEAILKAKNNKHKPSMIILDTVKGKGWWKAENTLNNHHMTITEDDFEEFREGIINQGGNLC